jgi:hypothetical protein
MIDEKLKSIDKVISSSYYVWSLDGANHILNV